MKPSTADTLDFGHTADLARRLTSFTFEDLDAPTVTRAKMLLLDIIGCMLAGATVPWTQTIRETLSMFGKATEGARVVHHGTLLNVADAAAINAVFAQGVEWDDYSTRKMGGAHVGAGTFPVALAVGEYMHANGRDLLVAAVAGCECMSRIGKTVRPSSDRRGHHPQGILTPYGAAAACGRLLNLDSQQMTMALSVASSFSGGLNEFTKTGGEVKRLYAGNGARGGIVAAYLSRGGFTGPPTILEGKEGFCHAYSDEPKLEELTLPPEEFDYAIMEADMKVYPAGGLSASSIEAMAALRAAHGFRHEDIASVRTVVAAKAAAYDMRRPADAASAQFSLPFSIALRAVIGANDLSHYMDEALWRDERILAVADKVQLVVAPEAVGDRRHSCTMTVTLADGRSLETHIRHPKGSIHNPLSQSELHDKFRVMSKELLGPARAGEVIDMVSRIESVDDVSLLVDALCGVRP